MGLLGVPGAYDSGELIKKVKWPFRDLGSHRLGRSEGRLCLPLSYQSLPLFRRHDVLHRHDG